MSKNLTSGFYWIHFKNNFQDEWVVAEYKYSIDGGYWNIPGSEEDFNTSDFFEVGSRVERTE